MRERLLIGGPASGRRIETDARIVLVPRLARLPLLVGARSPRATLPTFDVVEYVESALRPVMIPVEAER